MPVVQLIAKRFQPVKSWWISKCGNTYPACYGYSITNAQNVNTGKTANIMADVRVTKQFKDDFDTWAADRLASGAFSQAEMDAFKAMLRIDFAPGPDQLRAGYEAINAAGVAIPVAIDDHAERYRVWSVFFADEASQIRASYRRAA